MLATTDSNMMCSICLGDVEDGINMCCDKSHGDFCLSCVTSYVESTISSCAFGSCPAIMCPSLTHHTNKEVKLLRHDEWQNRISSDLLDKYHSLADSILLFRCGSCHTTRSLDVEYCAKMDTLETFLTADPSLTSAMIEADIETFCTGEYTVEHMYTLMTTKYFPQLKTLSNEEAWTIFTLILKNIVDKERRVNLHLRYLRDRPKMKTNCCNSNHCFKCVTVGHHDDRMCFELDSMDNTIVHCPACHVPLVKGDGCDSVTCMCGHHFCWSSQKDNRVRCEAFIQLYPVDTTMHCVAVLTSTTAALQHTEPILQARAYQMLNEIAVNCALARWFKGKYGRSTAQVIASRPASVYQGNTAIVGEAAELCASTMYAEIDQCRRENAKSVRSVFESLYPAEERALAAQRIANPTPLMVSQGTAFTMDSAVVASARVWINTNGIEMSKAVHDKEHRAIRQFLFLYGRRRIAATVNLILTDKGEVAKMYPHFVREIKHIYNQGNIFNSGSTYQCEASEWLNANNNDEALAGQRFDELEPAISALMHPNQFSGKLDDKNLAALGSVLWTDLIAMLSWARIHRVEECTDYFSGLFGYGDDEDEVVGSASQVGGNVEIKLPSAPVSRDVSANIAGGGGGGGQREEDGASPTTMMMFGEDEDVDMMGFSLFD